MKFSSRFAAACVLNAVGFNAFIVQTPQTSAKASSQSPLYSYLGSLGNDGQKPVAEPQSLNGAPNGLSGVDATRTRAMEVAKTQALESRLQELEQKLMQASAAGGIKTQGPPKTQSASAVSKSGNIAKKIWETSSPIICQGGSLRTWSFSTPSVERVHVVLKTEGRPLNANVELWQGPDNTPQKMGVYIEDGSLRPFNAVIETPRGYNAIAVRNTGQMEFPLSAIVAADVEDGSGNGSAATTKRLMEMNSPRTIQGGALHTYPFESPVDSVQILLKTDGRPLNARIELLQGPNNNKQVIEIYTEDGMERPFFAIIETPGSGNVVRVVNTATVEFPMTAYVEPYSVSDKSISEDDIHSGDYFMMNRQLL